MTRKIEGFDSSRFEANAGGEPITDETLIEPPEQEPPIVRKDSDGVAITQEVLQARKRDSEWYQKNAPAIKLARLDVKRAEQRRAEAQDLSELNARERERISRRREKESKQEAELVAKMKDSRGGWRKNL